MKYWIYVWGIHLAPVRLGLLAAKLGKNVRGKAGLNKAILDQGWGQLAVYLNTKSPRVVGNW
jgi:hypothetical protein